MDKNLFFKKHAIKIITFIVTIATVFIAYQEYQVSKLEATKVPVLVYYPVTLQPSEQDSSISDALKSLENKFISSAVQYQHKHPETNYSEALDAVLPVKQAVQLTPSGVVVVIKNMGTSTATDVRVIINSGIEILDFQVEANEVFEVLGSRNDTLKLEIEFARLTAGDEIGIAILYPVPNQYQYTDLIAFRGSYNNIISQFPCFGVEMDIEMERRLYEQGVATQEAIASCPPQPLSETGNMLAFSFIERLCEPPIEIFISSQEVVGVIASEKERNEDDTLYLPVLIEMYEARK